MKTKYPPAKLWLVTLVLLLVGAGRSALGQGGLSATLGAAAPKTVQFAVVSLTNNQALPIASSNVFVTSVTLTALKSVSFTNAPTSNSFPAYVGFKDAYNVTGVTSNNPAMTVVLVPGASWTLSQVGGKYNLADIYCAGTNFDRIIVNYVQ